MTLARRDVEAISAVEHKYWPFWSRLVGKTQLSVYSEPEGVGAILGPCIAVLRLAYGRGAEGDATRSFVWMLGFLVNVAWSVPVCLCVRPGPSLLHR